MTLWRSFAAMLALFLITACDRLPDYRYKMTIYVNTPDGERSFSSVRQVRVDETPSIVDSSGMRQKVTLEGEALILDLPGRTVYALLSQPNNPDYAAYVPSAALGPYGSSGAKLSEAQQELREAKGDGRPNARAEEAERLREMIDVAGAKELPHTRPNTDPYRGPREIDQWPMFVEFGDPNDPKSVRAVDPADLGIKRITIEITSEKTTHGIRDRLPWLAKIKGRSLSGGFTAVGSPYGLDTGSFELGQ